jgi:hypothetical protein
VSCAGTGDDERLAAYWLGDLDQAEAAELAVEEHLFDCDACFAVASRLGQIVWALRARVPSTLTSRAIERLGARGVRMKHTRIRAGERVTAVFDRDLDLLVHHLEHDLSEVERVDVEVRTTDGVALMAVPDLHSGSAGSTGSAGNSGSGGTTSGNAGRGGTTGGAGSGGMGGGAAGASGGGSGLYNPCPTNGDPCRILPVGDSITFGINQEGAWRIELFNKAVMAQQKITYTGTLQNGPTTVAGMPFPRRYEATSGITIDGISNQITSKNTLNMPCDIIVVHIGTNDMYGSNPGGAPQRLGTLLDKLIAGMPNALIVVTKIIPFPGGAAATMTYNNAIPGIVKTRADAGKHVIIVDLFTDFPSSGLSSDRVHPNVAGYAWMGAEIYDAIGSLFPR